MPPHLDLLRVRRRRVALIVETSLASGRDILSGIAHYLHEQGHWSVYLEARSLEEAVPRWLKDWDGDGIIARIQTGRIASAVQATGIPVVDVLGVAPNTGIPLVHVDDGAIGRIGAEHLLEKGFRNFGFLGIEEQNWAARRCAAFTARIAEAGYSCISIDVPRRTAQSKSWEQFEDGLANWVNSLPRPAGVMIASDQLGPNMLEACRRARAIVPDEIGVIGVDNDEPLCLVSDPSLTSVQPNHAGVGYGAARLLDRWMRGEGRPDDYFVPPAGIVVRQSTDALAIDDPIVAVAARFIREHACQGMNVDDVVRRAGVSRSVLQRRFLASLKRSIHDDILQTRLDYARNLLSTTELPLAQVAEKSGFRHQEYMGAVFKAKLGITPLQFRRGSSQSRQRSLRQDDCR